jgi:hypothetical protein
MNIIYFFIILHGLNFVMHKYFDFPLSFVWFFNVFIALSYLIYEGIEQTKVKTGYWIGTQTISTQPKEAIKYIWNQQRRILFILITLIFAILINRNKEKYVYPSIALIGFYVLYPKINLLGQLYLGINDLNDLTGISSIMCLLLLILLFSLRFVLN